MVRFDLAYDGSGFHGFARQPTVRTVQGELEAALQQILGATFETTCAGRTDAGVHARGQVVTFSIDEAVDLERLRRSLDGILGPEVSVWAARWAPDGFNARFSATGRTYRYFVDPRSAADPLTRGWVWHLGRPLDMEAMNEAAAGVVGRHDFASFCRRRPGATTQREVVESRWLQQENLAVYSITATAFCHQMVRSLTGFCVDVGLGRVDAGSVGAVIAARDRQAVGTVAPPHGLVLWSVDFDDF